MASSITGHHCFFLLALLLLSSTAFGQQLSDKFYAANCSTLDAIVTREVSRAVLTDSRMGASLLRLFFHDCFVQGCDASVLLDPVLDMNGRIILLSEKDAGPNKNSLRGFEVIDQIKGAVANECPNAAVSCADILALAARAAVVALKGPTWPLLLGRRDSMTANQMEANNDLPSPDSDLARLISAFDKKGFNATELVALSGAHTIGLAKCEFADGNQQNQKGLCPKGVLGTPLKLDVRSNQTFDNLYYGNLPNRGLLHSDKVLASPSVKPVVDRYTSNQGAFFTDFASAMKKMSELDVLTGTNNGQVRKNCRRVN